MRARGRILRAASGTILCADDYALSPGVSRAILDLAEARRISAASAFVTFDDWPDAARRIARLRDRIAVGLHLNLTVGKPLGPMPSLAPLGELPSLRTLVGRALAGRIDVHEISAETARQLARFESEIGFAPDHVDGHQHVHTLPNIRNGVLSALAARFPDGGPLVRAPADWRAATRLPIGVAAKAAVISVLSAGFARAARTQGLGTNATFAGVSSFDRGTHYAGELAAALRAPGPRHLVMCHPGHVDAELMQRDPLADRREDEYAAMMQDDRLCAKLWRPSRASNGPAIAWRTD